MVSGERADPPRPVVLVTGAGRGLGAVIAAGLAAAGHPVALNDRTASAELRAVQARIVAAGGRADVFAADVTEQAAVTGLVGAVGRQLGPVGVLVVNATGPQPAVALADLTWSDLLDQLNYFAKSPLLLVQAVLEPMRTLGAGRIVMIGSDLADRVAPGMSAYSAAKAAQRTLARNWARELGADAITVNVVAPGWIPVERHAGTDPAVLASYADELALPRLGSPADIAAAVVFLASDSAGFITGEQLTINGGHTLR